MLLKQSLSLFLYLHFDCLNLLVFLLGALLALDRWLYFIVVLASLLEINEQLARQILTNQLLVLIFLEEGFVVKLICFILRLFDHGLRLFLL